MVDFKTFVNEIISLVNIWENKLLSLPVELITKRRNSQNRSIKQIVGHLVDSASNNTNCYSKCRIANFEDYNG